MCYCSVQTTLKYQKRHLRQVLFSLRCTRIFITWRLITSNAGYTRAHTHTHTHTHKQPCQTSEAQRKIRLSHLEPMFSTSSTAYLRSANPQLSVSLKCLGLVLFEKLWTQMFPTCRCRVVATDPNLFQQACTQSKKKKKKKVSGLSWISLYVSCLILWVSKWLPESKCKVWSQF